MSDTEPSGAAKVTSPELPSAPSKKEPSNVARAFTEKYNILPLGAAIILSIATFSPLPMLALSVLGAGAVIEGAYLLFVPNSGWYAKRLSSKYDSEIIKRREGLRKQLFPKLRASIQSRYSRMETARKQMDDGSQDGNPRYREVLRKVDYLLEKYLQFAAKEQEFRQYLRSVLSECLEEKAPATTGHVTSRSSGNMRLPGEPPEEPSDVWSRTIVEQIKTLYDEELNSLMAQNTQDLDDLATNAVLDKRREVLHRRRDYVVEIGRISLNLNHQLELMEDTLGLINDEVRARTPEQVLADIDDVVYKTDAMMEMLDDVAPVHSSASSNDADVPARLNA